MIAGLERMGVGAVRNAIGCIERDLRTLEGEIRVFDLTSRRERTERMIANNLEVEATHQRLTRALEDLRTIHRGLGGSDG